MLQCQLQIRRRRQMNPLLVDQYKHIPIEDDGNSFFRAIAKAVYNDEEFHLTLRHSAMNRLQMNAEKYAAFMETTYFIKSIQEHKIEGVWEKSIAPMIPYIVSDILEIGIIVYDYNAGKIVNTFTYGPNECQVALVQISDTHYDLLERHTNIKTI